MRLLPFLTIFLDIIADPQHPVYVPHGIELDFGFVILLITCGVAVATVILIAFIIRKQKGKDEDK